MRFSPPGAYSEARAGNEDHLYVVPATNLMFTPEPKILPFDCLYEVPIALRIVSHPTSFYISIYRLHESAKPNASRIRQHVTSSTILSKVFSVRCRRYRYEYVADSELFALSFDITRKHFMKRSHITRNRIIRRNYTQITRNQIF